MPLAEATRLLAQGWEAGQVREADQFVRELEGEGQAGDGEGYDPAQPTEAREEEEGEWRTKFVTIVYASKIGYSTFTWIQNEDRKIYKSKR